MKRHVFALIVALSFAMAFGGSAQAQNVLGPPPDGGGQLVQYSWGFPPYYYSGPFYTAAIPWFTQTFTSYGNTYTTTLGFDTFGFVGLLPPYFLPWQGPWHIEYQTVFEFDLTGLAGVVTEENYQSAKLEGIRHWGWSYQNRILVGSSSRIVGAENDGDCNDVQLMDLCDDEEDGNATVGDFFHWWDIVFGEFGDENCTVPVGVSDGNLCIPRQEGGDCNDVVQNGPTTARVLQNGDCNDGMVLGPINVTGETRHDLFDLGQDRSWAGFLLKSNPWALGRIWVENGVPEDSKKPLPDRGRGESKNGGHFEWRFVQPDPHLVMFDFSDATLTITTRAPGDECADFLDNDGVCSPVEDDCDSGLDVTPDREQCHVASFKAKDAAGGDHCITLEMPVTPGTVQICFQDVQNPQDLEPPPPPPPSWVNLPFGLFAFKIINLGAGNCTTVTVHWDKADCQGCADPLDPGPQTYWKFGPTPNAPFDHWYDFSYNGRTGAEWIDENTMVLHFCDGERGDHDLSVNGVIDDPGGLAHISERPKLYFPYLTNLGGGFNADEPAFVGEDTTTLEMVNKSPYPVTGTITFYEADGTVAIDTKLIPSSPTNPFPETLTIEGVQPITIPGNGKLMLMPEEFPSNAVSAIVSADGDVVGFAGFRSGDGKRYAAPGSTTLTSLMTIPAVVANIDAVTGEGWKSGFGIFNPGVSAVTVEFQDDDVAGAPGDIALDPKASHFFWVEDASAEGFRTMLATGGAIVAMEVFEFVSSTRDVDTAALLLGNQNLPELCVPAILFGSGQFTSSGLGNPAAVAGMVSASGFDAALAETVVSLGTIPASGATGANLTTTFASDTLWAKIGADSMNLQGLGAYAENPAGSGPGTEQVATVSLNGLMFKDGCFGVVSSAAGSPIFALVNPGSVAADVIAFAYDDAGATVASSAGTVTILGKTTFGLTDLFGAADLTGATSIRVVSIESEEELCGLQVIPVDGRWEGLPILQ